MKIAHVITRLIIGGAQENTVLSCAGLRARGHHVTLIAGPETGPEGSLWLEAEQSADQIICVDHLRRRVGAINDWRAARELKTIFRRERFDVVHTHSSKAGILARWAAHRAGIPIIVHTIHGMSFNRTQPRAVQWVYKRLERRTGHWTHAIVSVADAMTAQARTAGIRPKNGEFVTIRSGMCTDGFRVNDAARRAVRANWQIPKDAVVIGTIARLFPNKGYENIIAAMPAIAERCPLAHFVWIGDGSHRPVYETEVTRLGLRDRLHLTGLVPPTDIPRLINGFDLLVHASQWEGLPRALVQAALTGVPAVSFDNDGAPEVIEDGVSGLLAPLGSTSALAEAVARLAGSETLRAELGRVAEQRCRHAFSHELMVKQLDELYTRLRS
jgi:glycosyltransferase involved in cell wall biosynthesis